MSIELKNVTYTYSPGTAYESHALKDVSLVIPDGQFIGIIGHTGSGKSTLIQHLNALVQPTSGQVLYNGEDVWAEKYDRKQLRSEVGLVFQYPEHQLFENDVISDVCFGPMNQGLSREEAEKEAKQALTQVGVKESNFKKSPFELSGGQKKRVAIAGVLAMNPKILILDEPTAALDYSNQVKILDMIRKRIWKIRPDLYFARMELVLLFPGIRWKLICICKVVWIWMNWTVKAGMRMWKVRKIRVQRWITQTFPEISVEKTESFLTAEAMKKRKNCRLFLNVLLGR